MKFPNQYRITARTLIRYPHAHGLISDNSYGNHGAAIVPNGKGADLLVIAADAEGWDHVSVTVIGRVRCPNWDEMCLIKSLFWEDDECVIQFHPPASQYVNQHLYCLHLWKPHNYEIPLPPTTLIGTKIK